MSDDWPAPDYWCTVCDRGAEGCTHTPSDAEGAVMSTTEPTEEMVEAGARAAWEAIPEHGSWDSASTLEWADVRTQIRAALRAALAVAPAPSEDDRKAARAEAERRWPDSDRFDPTRIRLGRLAFEEGARWAGARRSPVSPPEGNPTCEHGIALSDLCAWVVDHAELAVSPPEDVAALIAEANERHVDRQRYEEGTITRRMADARSADDVPKLIAALRSGAAVPVESEAVAWRREVADGTGYLIPETGQIAPASTVVAAFRENEMWANDYRENSRFRDF